MKSIESMTSKECTAALQELRARQREVVARLNAIEPAGVPMGAPARHSPGAPALDPLPGAGPEYRRVALEGSPAELAELTREHQLLAAEAVQLGFRADLLQERRKTAAAEEAKRAAPAKAKKLLEALPGQLDRVDAALLELAAARDALDEALQELDVARALNDGAPFYEPLILRRVWASYPRGAYSVDLLRRNLSTRPDPLSVMVKDSGGAGLVVDPQFRGDCLKRLEPATPSLVKRFLKRFATPAGSDQLAEHRQEQAEKDARTAAADARVRELAAPISA